MSKIKTLSLVAFILFSMSSCNDKSKALLQTWKIDNVKLSKEVPAEQKSFFDAMLAQMKESLRITYKADGTFEANFNGKVSKGKWELSKDAKTLTATDETGKTVKYDILVLEKTKLEYKTSDGNDPVTFTLVPGDVKPVSATPAAPATTEAPQEAAPATDTSAAASK
jgi:hypothetical protein